MSDVKTSILVVDDDLAIRELLHEHLSRVGYDVMTAAEGDSMRRTLSEARVDLIVLDVMLPGDDGFTLCREIREHSQVPIIMLTASSDETDRVVGLEIGADDYLAKPFSARELQARVKALLRRSGFNRADNPRFVCFDRWRLDTQAHELISDQGEATPKGVLSILPTDASPLLYDRLTARGTQGVLDGQAQESPATLPAGSTVCITEGGVPRFTRHALHDLLTGLVE